MQWKPALTILQRKWKSK